MDDSYFCEHCGEEIKIGEKTVEVSRGAINSYNDYKEFNWVEVLYYHEDCYNSILLGG